MKRAVQMLAVLCVVALTAALAAAATTQRVSVASDGREGNATSVWRFPCVSADGRYIAFNSEASNLVPDDTNGMWDVFVHDRVTGQTTRVSVASDGAEGDGWSAEPAISGDGRYVAFASGASNLVPNDWNASDDIFIHDCVTGVTERVSVASGGSEGHGPMGYLLNRHAEMSSDGRLVVFDSYAVDLVAGDTNNAQDVLVHDRLTGTTERVSVANDGSQGASEAGDPSISSDGRYIAFCSAASNLVPGDTNGVDDVFLRDRFAGTTERVSLAGDGSEGNGAGGTGEGPMASISADGRYIAFQSEATDLVPGDTNGFRDVFLRDRLTGQTERISVSSDGTQGDDTSHPGGVSAAGRYITFWSAAANLVAGDTNGTSDVFVHDRLTGQTERVSLANDGSEGNQGVGSWGSSSSADGRVVAFMSDASNLVPGDTNGAGDIFVRVRWPFRDVPPEQWAYSQINACVDASIVKGYADETYLPELEVTRDQMAVFIARAMDGGEPTGPATVAFTDITNPWANLYIAYCVEHGVVKGFDATHYGPTQKVDRGSMAVFIARAKGWVSIDDDMTTAPELFADVPAGHWAGTAIAACVEHGVVNGYDATHYQPTWIVTRDQMAVFVQRAFQLPV